MSNKSASAHFWERFFPPPTFLTMPAAGIDVSDTSIKFVEFNHAGHVKELLHWGEECLPDGAVVGGEIRNGEAVTKALKALRERVATHFVRASLPEQEAYFFRTPVAKKATHQEIVSTLEFQLEQHVPLSPAQAIIEYERIPADVYKDEVVVGVTVYPRVTVGAYSSAFTAAGLFPLSYELEAQAIIRSVLPRDEKETVLILDFGENSVGLSIVSHGALHFTSTLDIAGKDITQAIMSRFDLKKEEVAEVKNAIGLVSAEHPKLAQQMQSCISKLSREVKRHVTFWNTRERNEMESDSDIEQVIICGGNANLNGLPEYLEGELDVPVARANVWINAFSFKEMIPEMQREISLSYATAIGLALRERI